MNKEHQRNAGYFGLKTSPVAKSSPCYKSCASFSARSSILMSLSSLDSNTSRHSRHSTNSASSSRLTTCTRGCLHGCGVLGGGENGFELINPEAPPFDFSRSADSREFPGIVVRLGRLSSPPVLQADEIYSAERTDSDWYSPHQIWNFRPNPS